MKATVWMALNLDIIGKRTETVRISYNAEKVILYALGIGAGVSELDFIYEKHLKVFPTFSVVPDAIVLPLLTAKTGVNFQTLLHGEEKIFLHRPIPVSGTLYASAVCTAIYDKGDHGAVITYVTETRDEAGGLLFETHNVTIDRSAGNFGGERGPKEQKRTPPAGKTPDFRVEHLTSAEQAALYRLSGDMNLVHIDPEFARDAGFPGPILQGLCTFGFAGRAILHSVCASDPSRFKSFGARFTGAVSPGDALITEGWEAEKGVFIVQTRNRAGRIVLGNGLAEVA